MSRWQNLSKGFFNGIGHYDVPEILPTYDLPIVSRHIEFDYCMRIRENHNDIGVHFFEDDYKFERVWADPDRYAKMLSKFGYVIGPDFSTYADFPLAVRIYNHYRNNWLCRYWQVMFNITVIPTVMWEYEDSYEWCFDGIPNNSIVAVSNVGITKSKEDKDFFIRGYTYMLEKLKPIKILLFTRNFMEVPGNVQYIRWELHKGDQLYGNR